MSIFAQPAILILVALVALECGIIECASVSKRDTESVECETRRSSRTWLAPCIGTGPILVEHHSTTTTSAATTSAPINWYRVGRLMLDLLTYARGFRKTLHEVKSKYTQERLDVKSATILEDTSIQLQELPSIPDDLPVEGIQLHPAFTSSYKHLTHSVVLIERAINHERSQEANPLTCKFVQLQDRIDWILCQLQRIMHEAGHDHDVENFLTSDTVKHINSVSSSYPLNPLWNQLSDTEVDADEETDEEYDVRMDCSKDMDTARHCMDYLLMRDIDRQISHLKKQTKYLLSPSLI